MFAKLFAQMKENNFRYFYLFCLFSPWKSVSQRNHQNILIEISASNTSNNENFLHRNRFSIKNLKWNSWKLLWTAREQKRSAKLEHTKDMEMGKNRFELPVFQNRRFCDEEKPKYLRSFRIYCCLFTSGQFFFYLGATVSINMFALHLAYSDHHHHHKKIYTKHTHSNRSNKNPSRLNVIAPYQCALHYVLIWMSDEHHK